MTEKVQQKIEITSQDLPLCCPQSDAPLWARHPRVYLQLDQEGKAICPYCGAWYVYSGQLKSHH